MLADLVLLALCFLMAASGLAVVAFEVISGRVLSIDGLSLSLICLALVAVFGGNLAWSLYTGEAQHAVRHFRQRHAAVDASSKERPSKA